MSVRQLHVLQLVAESMSNGEIAESLKSSRGTIETHVRHICKILAVNSRLQGLLR